MNFFVSLTIKCMANDRKTKSKIIYEYVNLDAIKNVVVVLTPNEISICCTCKSGNQKKKFMQKKHTQQK